MRWYLTNRQQSSIIFFIGVDCIIVTVTSDSISSVQFRYLINIGSFIIDSSVDTGVDPGVVVVDARCFGLEAMTGRYEVTECRMLDYLSPGHVWRTVSGFRLSPERPGDGVVITCRLTIFRIYWNREVTELCISLNMLIRSGECKMFV